MVEISNFWARRQGRAAALLALAFLLSACGTLQMPSGSRFGAARSAPVLYNSTAGSLFNDQLRASDRRLIDETAWTATVSQGGHGRFTWTNPSTGSNGVIQATPVYLVGFNAGAEIEAPVGLDTSWMLDPAAGDYITTANANVRLSPSRDGERVSVVVRGNRLKAVAREPVERWLLVSSNGRIVGYVFEDLLTKVEGGDLLLLGGMAQRPRLCRELTYKVEFKYGQTDQWVNGACKEGRGDWQVVGGHAVERAS